MSFPTISNMYDRRGGRRLPGEVKCSPRESHSLEPLLQNTRKHTRKPAPPPSSTSASRLASTFCLYSAGSLNSQPSLHSPDPASTGATRRPPPPPLSAPGRALGAILAQAPAVTWGSPDPEGEEGLAKRPPARQRQGVPAGARVQPSAHPDLPQIPDSSGARSRAAAVTPQTRAAGCGRAGSRTATG